MLIGYVVLQSKSSFRDTLFRYYIRPQTNKTLDTTTLDRLKLDTTNPRYNKEKTYHDIRLSSFAMTYGLLCLMLTLSSVCLSCVCVNHKGLKYLMMTFDPRKLF